jgi:hypothetical protein
MTTFILTWSPSNYNEVKLRQKQKLREIEFNTKARVEPLNFTKNPKIGDT